MKQLSLLAACLFSFLAGTTSALAISGGIGPAPGKDSTTTAEVTFYGKGQFILASGKRVISERDLFVAHRKLPFGTRVEFIRAGKKTTATVLDRGPYVSGVTWDLSWRAAEEIGILTAGRARVRYRVLGPKGNAGNRTFEFILSRQ